MAKDSLVEKYVAAHPGSAKLHQRALESFSGDGATHMTRIFDPFRPYITHARGSRKWDVDGKEYIDYTMGHGALMLGHCYPEVVRAVQEQAARGVHFGENQELEVEWAELIRSMMPWVERVEFFACGNEANMMALRLGRVFTGRKKVLKFEEHFHGWCDQLTFPGAAGVLPEDNLINTVTIPSNDLDLLEKELATGEYAVLITEGGGAHMAGQYPLEDDFVRALPILTKQYGTVWVVDEVVTGFRDSPAGWQGLLGVKADVTTLGKAIGGGLPVGAVVGRADIMDAFSTKTPVERRIRHSGTWNANPMVAAAGIAALKVLKTGEPFRKAHQAAAWLRQGFNRALERRGVSGRFYGRTMVHGYLGPVDFEPANDTLPPSKDIHKLLSPTLTATWNRMLLHLLQRGVANLAGRLYALSAAHTKEDIEQTVQAFGDSLDAMTAEGTLAKS